MDILQKTFSQLGVDNAPGQEITKKDSCQNLRGLPIKGRPVDFSHGDVNAFPPLPGSLKAFSSGFYEGSSQAYTEYRGRADIRCQLADDLTKFFGTPVDGNKELILTGGTQSALFLAIGSLLPYGGKLAMITPDYFANRKLAAFFGADVTSIPLSYLESEQKAGIDLNRLEDTFKKGVDAFLFSNPNNPTGAVYSAEEIRAIGKLASHWNVPVIVDELYSRQVFDSAPFTHLCAEVERPETVVTIIGPSKTESLSGFRLGAAFAPEEIIERMEKLQAIVSLRAAGYCQSVFRIWFHEPVGFMEQRIQEHRHIRDILVGQFRSVPDVRVRKTNAGSYLFPTLPELDVPITEFVHILRMLGGVIVTPGTEFGPEWTQSIRLNFSQDSDAAVDGVKRLLKIMERYRKE